MPAACPLPDPPPVFTFGVTVPVLVALAGAVVVVPFTGGVLAAVWVLGVL